MAYNSLFDFLALIRNGASGAEIAKMPGLDYVVAAMARANMFRLSTGQTAPVVNQSGTVWLKPSLPSWVAEGTIYLWNAAAAEYEPATPELWQAVLSNGAGNYVFQAVSGVTGVVDVATSLLAIERDNPAGTAILLPSIVVRGPLPLQLVDWSTNVANHIITVTGSDGATIMRRPSWGLLSTADQLAGITFQPSPDLNGWVIAP